MARGSASRFRSRCSRNDAFGFTTVDRHADVSVVHDVGDRHGVDAPLGVHRAQDPVVVRREPGPRRVLGEPHRAGPVAVDMSG